MKPGRELDELIAERVMGLQRGWLTSVRDDLTGFEIYGGDSLQKYSTDIAAAWEVVEKLLADGWELTEAGYSRTTRKWDFTFGNGCSFDGPLCDTAPHAICLAALKAVAPREDK
jgi:hypothetical protein